MSFILAKNNVYSPVNSGEPILRGEVEVDELVIRIRSIVQRETNAFADYWKCCFCFCPKLFSSPRIYSYSDSLKNELIDAFKNTLNSHVYRESPFGISLSDGEGCLIDCNDAYLKLMGYSKEEIINHHFSKRIDEVDYQNAKKKRFEFSNRTCVEQYEIRVKRKDNSYFWSQVTVSSVLDLDGNPCYIITQINDISELKEAQQNLEQKIEERTAQLEERTKELEQLTKNHQIQEHFVRNLMATNSHEMRTAIGGMVGCSKILQEDRNILNIEEQDHLLSTLSASSEHLLKMLNDNLDFSKIQEGQISIVREMFSISDLLETIHASNASKLDKSMVDLSFNVCEKIPSSLIGDATRIRQVVENLLSNAIKFTEEGDIRVEVSLVDNDHELNDEVLLLFSIENSGDAIPPAVLSTFFSPYQQGPHSKGGTGLGLVIAKGLVEAMGGEMFQVISPVNEKGGTRFSFSIKVSDVRRLSNDEIQEITERSSVEKAKKRLKGKQILIAEDSPLNQKIVGRILGREGLINTFVNNGLEAVEALKKKPNYFDLVLMDVQMPVMDGLEATNMIRTALHLNALPILGLTANGPSYEKICLDAGMNAYSEKPIHENNLFLKMDELISGSQTIRIVRNRKNSSDSFSS